MARSQVLLNAMSNVVAGTTATLSLPVGRTFDQIGFRYSGVTLAQIKNINVNVNGKSIQHFKDATRLNALNAFYKRNVTAGFLDFHFKQSEMKTLAEQRMFALGTASPANGAQLTAAQMSQAPVVQVVTITMDIDAGAAAPVITAFAVQSDPTTMGSVVKVKNFPKSVSAGINEVDNIPRIPSTRIKAIHLHTAAVVKSAVLKIDGTEVTQLDRVVVEKLQVTNGRAPQAEMVSSDFCLEGDMLQAIPMTGIQDMRLVITTADDTPASTPLDLTVEFFDVLDGI